MLHLFWLITNWGGGDYQLSTESLAANSVHDG